MTKLYLIFLFLSISFFAHAQDQALAEMQGRVLDSSFPSYSQGAIEPDLPASGFWWDKDNPGSGITLEVQSRPASSTGYFMFLAGYFYDENHQQFWCVASDEYQFNEDVYQWRENRAFSNLKDYSGGHDNEPVMAEFDTTCYVMNDGSSINSATHRPNSVLRTLSMHLLFKNPTSLEFSFDGGTVHTYKRLDMHDDLVDPSGDWIKDYTWKIFSSIPQYQKDVYNEFKDVTYDEKSIFNTNVQTRFVDFDIEQYPEFKDYIGAKSHYKYFIAKLPASRRRFLLRDIGYVIEDGPYETVLSPYAPILPRDDFSYFNFSGEYMYADTILFLLVLDNEKNRLMLYQLVDYKYQTFIPDWNLSIDFTGQAYWWNDLQPEPVAVQKFVANINPDSDILDFYPMMCEGTASACLSNFDTSNVEKKAVWDEAHVHKTSLKMTKIRVDGHAYEFYPNNGESLGYANLRHNEQLNQEGILPFVVPND